MSRIQELKRNLSLALQDSKWERALAVLEKLISLEENQPAFHNQTGDVYLKMGRRAEAIESFLRGVKAYRDLGMYPNGGALCKKVLRLEPDHREAIWILGELKTRQGFLADGADKILDAIRLYGEDPSTTKETLLELLEGGLQLQGGNLDILEHAASVYVRLNEEEAARATLLRIAEIEERDGNKQRAAKLRQDAGVAAVAPPSVDLESLVEPQAQPETEPAAAADAVAEAPPESVVDAAPDLAVDLPAAAAGEEALAPVHNVQGGSGVEESQESSPEVQPEPLPETQLEPESDARPEPPSEEPTLPVMNEPASVDSIPDAVPVEAHMPASEVLAAEETLGEDIPAVEIRPAVAADSNKEEEQQPVSRESLESPAESLVAPPADAISDQTAAADSLAQDEHRPPGEEAPSAESDAIAEEESVIIEEEIAAPEDLRSLLEAVDEADPHIDSDTAISHYAISDPEPLDVALRHAVEEVMKEEEVSDRTESETGSDPLETQAEQAGQPEEAATDQSAPATRPEETEVEPSPAKSQVSVLPSEGVASMADVTTITTPGGDSLHTLEEMPAWQPAAMEDPQDALADPPGEKTEHTESASREPAAPEPVAEVDAPLVPEPVAEADAPLVPEPVAEADSPAMPELELPSQAEVEASEMLAEAESSAKDDWLGLSEEAASDKEGLGGGVSLHPFEIKDVSEGAKPNQPSSNGDGKKDSLSNISVGLMGSERELCTDQVEQVFAEFRHRMADQLGNLAPEERYQLGVSYMEMGLVEEALEEFEPCLEHPTFGHQAREWMARCLLQLERPAEVVRLLEQTLADEPYPRKNSVELYYILGQAYELLEQRDRALDAFNKVYQLDTEFRDVQSRLENLTSAG